MPLYSSWAAERAGETPTHQDLLWRCPLRLKNAVTGYDWRHDLSTGHVTRQGVIPAVLKPNIAGLCVDQLRHMGPRASHSLPALQALPFLL